MFLYNNMAGCEVSLLLFNVSSMNLYYSDFHPDFKFRFSQDFWARNERNDFFFITHNILE
jgi:hypothetical protein